MTGRTQGSKIRITSELAQPHAFRENAAPRNGLDKERGYRGSVCAFGYADLRSGISHSGFASKQLVAPDSLLEAHLGEGDTWFDSAPPGERVTAGYERQLLAAYARAVGAQHIVQGHQHGEVRFADGVTRHAGEMFQRWGLLFLIDVGMSQGFGDSHGAVLRITNGKAEAICASESRLFCGCLPPRLT